MNGHDAAAAPTRTDWPVFVTTVLVILLLSVPIVAFLVCLGCGHYGFAVTMSAQ
jgi:hypothetical protein